MSRKVRPAPARPPPRPAESSCRQVHEEDPRAPRLCHRGALQPRRDTYRLLRPRWPHVSPSSIRSFACAGLRICSLCSRIWNTTTGQCLKTLAESHDAIWYASPPFHSDAKPHTSRPSRTLRTPFAASTFSSRRTPSTSSPPRMTARSGFGTTKRRAASRRTSGTQTRSSASPPASPLRAASGSSPARRTTRSTCGTSRAARSSRRSKATLMSSLLLR